MYLDNAATTPVDKEVLKEMLPYFEKNFENASTLYKLGREARRAVEKSRKIIADFLQVSSEEIIFTSGGTEANNLAIKGVALANPGKKQIITSVIEHPSVLETCRFLEKQGYRVDYIPVDKEGIVSVEEIKRRINKDTLLVSVMHVNNEIGTIQPIEEIAEICRQKKVLFHTDAVQSFGKLKIDASKFDLLSASGHKINCVKGVGFLYIKKGIRISGILNGGGQERGMRSGTENVSGIVSLGKAVEIAEERIKNKESERVERLRDKIINELLKINGTRLNGSRDKRIFSNVNISFENIEGEALVLLLDDKGICCSTGSACSSHSLKASSVLKAIGLGDFGAHGSLRITLGWQNNEKEIDFTINEIKKAVARLRKISADVLTKHMPGGEEHEKER
ncbi:MAG: cysteine desulfurase [Nanoarchaeota archaeon]|nr:cysteine desulfurase [Nanoarchaeota archaeon]MBU4086982.1 cysteine desulfurase [Nanoarchaeota archaeon]